MSSIQKKFNANTFKRVYTHCMNLYWKVYIHRLGIIPQGEIKDFPCVYLNFYREHYKWNLFCEPDFETLGMCTNKNIFDELSYEFYIFLKSLKKKMNIIPIHINLSLFDEYDTSVHANTCFIHVPTKRLYVFEPMGTTFHYKPNFHRDYILFWKKMSETLGLEYKGFLVPECRFQTNDSLCYLWTSWAEMTCLENKFKFHAFRRYLRRKNNLVHNNYLYSFGNKLLELIE